MYNFKDQHNNIILTTTLGNNKPENYVGTTYNGVLIHSVEPYIDPREERAGVFATTLDVMNPIWYNSLTTEQQTELVAWRQAWLDYPETGVKPDNLSFM